MQIYRNAMQMIDLSRGDSLGAEHWIVAPTTRVRFPVFPLFDLRLPSPRETTYKDGEPWLLSTVAVHHSRKVGVASSILAVAFLRIPRVET
jgi:hypothetical protein